MRRLFFALFALILSCGCRTLPTERPVTEEIGDVTLLRYTFSPGEELPYVLRSSVSSQAPGVIPSSLSVKHEVEFHRKVLEVLPGGRAKIAVVIDKLKFVASGPGREDIVLDSDDAETLRRCPEETRGIAFLVGKEIEIEQRPSGEITAVTGLAPIYREALSELSRNERQPVERLMREMANNPSGLLGLDVVFPPGPVRDGQSWLAEKGPFPMFCGRLAYDCEYLFKEVSDRYAIVEFKGELGAAESQPGSRMRELRKATVEGVFAFDLEKGTLREMHGESSSFVRAGGREQLRTRTTWELTLRNKRFSGETENLPQTEAPK